MVPVSSPRSFCRKVGSQVLAPQYAASVSAETIVPSSVTRSRAGANSGATLVRPPCGAPARLRWRSASQVSDSGT